MAVFRIEKTRDYTVMANHHLRNTALSLKAKGLLSLMLSLPEDWDYTTKGLARICRDGVDSICATVRELEDAGYIIRERVRNANGRLGSIEYTILEQPRPPEPKPGKPERENPVQVKPVLDSPVLGKPEQENPAQLNTKGSSNQISNTDSSSTEGSNPIQSSPQTPAGGNRAGRDWMRERENYRELILENIEYDYLCRDDRLDRDMLNELVELMVDTVCSRRETIRIAGDDYPAEVVKSRFLKLNSSHIEYVLDRMRENTTYVRNIKKYLLAALYNAPATMERTEKIRATLINLFEDKIVCADCGRKLYFHRKRVDKRKDGAWYAFYECSSSVKRGNLCTPHYTRQDKLEADVLAAIQLQVKAALNYDKLLAKLRNSEGERSIRDQQNALITSLNLKLSGISKKRTRLYEDFTEGILDEEEYAFAKKAYDEQYVDLSRRLDEAVQRKVKFAEAMSEDNKWLTLMKSVSGATMLSHELVDESVELVKVHEDGSIELVMKYGDIYALTVQSIKEVQEAM